MKLDLSLNISETRSSLLLLYILTLLLLRISEDYRVGRFSCVRVVCFVVFVLFWVWVFFFLNSFFLNGSN